LRKSANTPLVSFYPGPSAIYPEIVQYTQEALDSGILSSNHRSPIFVDLCKKTVQVLKENLGIPEDYTIFFTSSATECWEIIAQSLISGSSAHFYNGAFGRRWMEVTKKIYPKVEAIAFDLNEVLSTEKSAVAGDNSIICLTHTETSNGTQLLNETIASFGTKYPKSLLAIDATSSLNGISLDISSADIWYASVQKCFGLPSGMGIMICSPRVRERALSIGENNHYNSMVNAYEMMDKFQTTHTPNILNIYLLYRTLQQSGPVISREKILKDRAKIWYDFFAQHGNRTRLLVENETVRSETVIAVMGEESMVEELKKSCFENGFVLGNGYKEYAKNTFRIANFPAIEEGHIRSLMAFLKDKI